MNRPMTRKSFLARDGMPAAEAGLLAEEGWANSKGRPPLAGPASLAAEEGVADDEGGLARL